MNKDNQDLKAIQYTKATYSKELEKLKKDNGSDERIKELENRISELTTIEMSILSDTL